MTKGIILLALGKPSYGKLAFNLALSLKINADISIHLVYEKEAISHLKDIHLQYFDTLEEINPEDSRVDGRLDPGKAKLGLYKYLPFDYNIYLDVDSLCVPGMDINNLFAECIALDQPYLTQLTGILNGIESAKIVKTGIGEKRDFKEMQWAWADDIYKKYALPDEAILPAINSSFAFIKKCDESKALYEQALKNINDPIPIKDLRTKWGYSQPDELYMNIALCQMGLVGRIKEDYPVYFSSKYREDLIEHLKNYYIIGLYGGAGFTHNTIVEYADRVIHKYSVQHLRRNIDFKTKSIMKDKHVNIKK